MQNPLAGQAQPKIMFSVCEVSGDAHGAALATEIKKISPEAYLFGMGGESMRRAGVDIRIDITEASTIGIAEAVRNIPINFIAFLRMRSMLKRMRPDALVLIDAQGFNMPLAKSAKALGIKTVYYIAPQEWLWGTEKGVKAVAQTITKIIAIFEEEAHIYTKAGANVSYFGHPVVDVAKPTLPAGEIIKRFNIDINYPIIGLFPGSRMQEINSIFPIMLEVCRIIDDSVGGGRFLLGVASSKLKGKIEKLTSKSGLNITLIEGMTYDLLKSTDVNIAASGTITLEAACLDSPIVMLYKVSPITYFIGKKILKIKLPFYSMPNLLAGKRIIPEFVQKDINPKLIADQSIHLIVYPELVSEMRRGFASVRAKLGEPGVVERVAKEIINVCTVL